MHVNYGCAAYQANIRSAIMGYFDLAVIQIAVSVQYAIDRVVVSAVC